MKGRQLLVIVLLSFGVIAEGVANPIEKMRKAGWEFEVKAGVNLGGVAPIPFPAEIREVSSFNPKFNGLIELQATNWLREKFGISLGVSFEQKGMETEALVRNYQMQLVQGESMIEGNWTGRVRSNFSATYFTFPVQAVYKFGSRLRFSGGFSLGFRLDGDFSGDVYDGYFRQGSSTGERIDFSENTKAPYSFQEYLRPLEFGIKLGSSMRVYRNFLIFADLKCGFTGIFKKGFTAVTYKMFPFYLGTGFSYRF